MEVLRTELPQVHLVKGANHSDVRGHFARLFCDKELEGVLGPRKIVQINHSLTGKKGSIRGLHFQKPPSAEMKFIRCLRGKVWDVAVDLRQSSPTFLRWQAFELSPENNEMLVIPEGCAHGFQTLSDDCELLYLHTAHYDPANESGVRWNDPRLKITWPLPLTDQSDRDRGIPLLDSSFRGIAL